MNKKLITVSPVLLLALAGCPGERTADPAPGDTAAVRMEREGAAAEQTMPDGVVDTAVVTTPTGTP